MVSSPASSMARITYDDLAQVDERVLRDLLARRRRHGPLRAVSVLACAAAALTILTVSNERDGAWGLLLLYGVPLVVVVASDLVARFFWRRHARSRGLSDKAIDALRAKLATVPRSIPPASVDTLLAAVRAR